MLHCVCWSAKAYTTKQVQPTQDIFPLSGLKKVVINLKSQPKVSKCNYKHIHMKGVELAAYDQSQTRTALHYKCILAERPIL